MSEIKYRAYIVTPKEDWLGVDNYDSFDWENRMRQVSSIHFPLNSPSGKDISCQAICEDDNYASGWHGNTYIDPNKTKQDIEYILMQYTGLKDANCIEIYDGDIVMDVKPWVVYWNQSLCQFRLQYANFSGEKALTPPLASELEVIGNIHEHPELLNK